jgi:NodT family efflux transporter outer membrane factor (OMF) lipoprotein
MVGPDYSPPVAKAPDRWTEPHPSVDEAQATERLKHWWNGFRDPVIDHLVSEAVANNYDVKIATQRLLAARASRDVVASALSPQVASGALIEETQSGTTQRATGVGLYSTFQGGFDASWEIDVFGGIHRGIEAANANIGASAEDRRDILVSLLAELATNYATLRAAQERLAIAERNLAIAQEALRLTQLRLAHGLDTDIDMAQAQAQLETVRAVMPELKATIARMIHAESILIGSFPDQLRDILEKPGPPLDVPIPLPLTFPSQVMRNRPDIRRAERKLAASTARIGVAAAQFFPRFKIPLGLGLNSSTLPLLLTPASVVWTIGLGVTEPIYTGGKLPAQKDIADAIAESDRLAYEQVVRVSFRDVEDALVGYDSQNKRSASLAAATAANRTAYGQASRLYANGLTDFLKVLTSERGLYATEDDLAQSRLAEVRQIIALFKALGGGWQDFLPDDPVGAGEPP